VRVVRLSDEFRTLGFHSGNDEIDEWLTGHALESQSRNICRTSLLLSDADEIIGFYSLCSGGVRRADGHEVIEVCEDHDLTMVMLERLAVAEDHHSEGLGRELLIDALVRSLHEARESGAAFICADPIGEAGFAFYEHYGFAEVPGDPDHRMYLPIADVAHLLKTLESAGLVSPGP
jgi:GNAT superfamily N-acetyltransferase